MRACATRRRSTRQQQQLFWETRGWPWDPKICNGTLVSLLLSKRGLSTRKWNVQYSEHQSAEFLIRLVKNWILLIIWKLVIGHFISRYLLILMVQFWIWSKKDYKKDYAAFWFVLSGIHYSYLNFLNSITFQNYLLFGHLKRHRISN